MAPPTPPTTPTTPLIRNPEEINQEIQSKIVNGLPSLAKKKLIRTSEFKKKKRILKRASTKIIPSTSTN